MDSGRQTANSGDRSSNQWANVIGTLIALITLTLPILGIAHYSDAARLSQIAPSSIQESRK